MSVQHRVHVEKLKRFLKTLQIFVKVFLTIPGKL